MWLLGLLIVAGAIYDGWILYSRSSENREAAHAASEKEASHERKTLDAYGGGGLKILDFYAAPATVKRGAQTNLCYGVTGAKTVRMEPAVDAVWPAVTRCVQVSPKKDTEYRFIAEDGAGHSVTNTIAVKVKP
jgi:hypothetical protein